MATGTEQRARHIVVACRNVQESQFLTLLLGRFGYDAGALQPGAEVRDFALSRKSDLVIADAPPPGPGGADVFRALQDDRRSASLPVVVLVPLSDAAAESRCLGMGAAACITKPVQAEELYRTVQGILESRPRINMRIGATIALDVNGVAVDCGTGMCTVDLSTYGMFIPMPSPYPRNRLVAVRLHLRDRVVTAKGSVLFSYVSAAGSRKQSGMGLKFTEITPTDQDVIRQYIHDEVTRSDPPAAFNH